MTDTPTSPDDDALARDLSAAVRTAEGVGTIFRTSPLVDAAAQAVASTLNLPEPELRLRVDTVEDHTAVTVHLSTTGDRPTPDTLRAVAALIRKRIAGTRPGHVSVTVKVLQIERPSGD